VLPESLTKVLRRLAALPGLLVGVLVGLLVTIPFARQANTPPVSNPNPTPLEIASLSPAELETLALDVLNTLAEKRGGAAETGSATLESSWGPAENDLRRIHLGMNNVRRLLPLAKRLTLESLTVRLKTSSLYREKRLITSVRKIVLDPRLSDSAEVWEGDLSVIRVGPDYAACLTSDDEAMLLLGHELTHVAARSGRLRHFIESVNEVARESVSLKLDKVQKEELTCDFTGAEVLKRYIALYPTTQTSAGRFARAFGYEPLPERLTHAWQNFCASYNGDPMDEEHLSWEQTLRTLPGLDPELKALIPDDAISPSLCR
jgi:hypothetical protein